MPETAPTALPRAVLLALPPGGRADRKGNALHLEELHRSGLLLCLGSRDEEGFWLEWTRRLLSVEEARQLHRALGAWLAGQRAENEAAGGPAPRPGFPPHWDMGVGS